MTLFKTPNTDQQRGDDDILLKHITKWKAD